MRADRDALQGTLDERSSYLHTIEHDLATLRRNGGGGSEALAAENAALRRRIDEVAEEIMRAAEKTTMREPAEPA